MREALLFLMFATLCTVLQAQQAAKSPATTPAKSSKLNGIFSGPAGSVIILQNNAKNDLTLTAKKEPGITYSNNAFSFGTPFPDSSKYKVSIKKFPTGQTAIIYAVAAGTMPQNANTLRVCSDYTYDHVSRSSDDKTFSTFYETNDPSIGGNAGEEGRYVAFVSASSGFAGTSGKHRQIFWRDRNTSITKLISAAPNGDEGNGDSYAPAISGDGKSVAFESYSSNLVESDKNGLRDIFIWNSETNQIKTVSIGAKGVEADAESYEPTVSGDGNLVAFTSNAGNLSAIQKGTSNNNVFLRDLQNDVTTLISVDPESRTGGGGSRPSISSDGNRIAFYSHTATLVKNDNNGFWDIFLWENNQPKLKRVSLTADHKERNQGSESANRIVVPSISGDGQFIAYTTTADNMVPGDDNNSQDVFVYDITKDTTVIASINSAGKPGDADSPIDQGEKIAISFDGKWVAFSTKATNLGVPASNILMRNMLTGENRVVSSVAGSSVGRPSMSRSGCYVVFGIGGQLDSRFPSSGIFAHYTGLGPCRFCPE